MHHELQLDVPPIAVVDVSSPGFALGLRSVFREHGIPVGSIGDDPAGRGVLVADLARLRRGAQLDRIVAVLDRPTASQFGDALRVGSRGFVLRDGPVDTFLEAVRTVGDGHCWLAGQVYEILSSRIPPAARCLPDRSERLTKREEQVLGLLVRGMATADAAEQLSITAKTFKLHVSNILRKMGVSSRAAAVARATGYWSEQLSSPGR